MNIFKTKVILTREFHLLESLYHFFPKNIVLFSEEIDEVIKVIYI